MSPYQAGRLEKEFRSTKEGVVCGGGFRCASAGSGALSVGRVRLHGFWAQAPFLCLRFSIHSRLDLGIGRGAKQESKKIRQVILTPIIRQFLTTARVFCAIFPGICPNFPLISRLYSKKIEYFEKNQRILAKKCKFLTILLDI